MFAVINVNIISTPYTTDVQCFYQKFYKNKFAVILVKYKKKDVQLKHKKTNDQ